MGQVDITVNGKAYRIACEDGEEQRLEDLAGVVDGHVQELVAQVGAISDSRLLVMASLLIADELADLRDNGGVSIDGQNSDAVGPPAGIEEENLAETINQVAARIEGLSDQFVRDR